MNFSKVSKIGPKKISLEQINDLCLFETQEKQLIGRKLGEISERKRILTFSEEIYPRLQVIDVDSKLFKPSLKQIIKLEENLYREWNVSVGGFLNFPRIGEIMKAHYKMRIGETQKDYLTMIMHLNKLIVSTSHMRQNRTFKTHFYAPASSYSINEEQFFYAQEFNKINYWLFFVENMNLVIRS